jgi:quinol monooxygenase YgiN
MYARVTTAYIRPEKVDEAVRVWRESVMPAAAKQPGFLRGQLLVDRKMGLGMAIGLWESAAHADATGEGSAYLQEQLEKFAHMFSAPPVVEHYEHHEFLPD